MDNFPIDTLSDVSLTDSEHNSGTIQNANLEKVTNPPASSSVFNLELNKTKRLRKRKKRFNGEPSLCNDSEMTKWWRRRYDLFQRFDEGIKMDKESWYSVTPEEIARRQAQVCACHVIVDGFAGAGGNSIQFAQTCNFVVSVDNSINRLNLLVNNAQVYGVKQRIDVVCGDLETVLRAFRQPLSSTVSVMESKSSKEPTSLNADVVLEFKSSPPVKASPIEVVFLSPPWGGQNYKQRVLPPGSSSWNTKRRKQWFQSVADSIADEEDLEPAFSLEAEEGAIEGIGVLLPGVVKAARTLTANVTIYLPRNTCLGHMLKLGWETETLRRTDVMLEDYWLRGRRLAICAYLGDFPLLQTEEGEIN